MTNFKKTFSNKETAKSLNDLVSYEICIKKTQKGFLFEEDLFENLTELVEYLQDRYLTDRTQSQIELNKVIISEIVNFFSETETQEQEQKTKDETMTILEQNEEIVAVEEKTEYKNKIVHFVKKFEDVFDINKNIEYASASAIVAELEAMRKANAPESQIQVLLGILHERKEFLETALRLTESALGKVFQHNFRNSLVDNYKYYQKELQIIKSAII